MQYFIKIAGNGYPGSFVTLNRPRFTIPVGTTSRESRGHQNMNIPLWSRGLCLVVSLCMRNGNGKIH